MFENCKWIVEKQLKKEHFWKFEIFTKRCIVEAQDMSAVWIIPPKLSNPTIAKTVGQWGILPPIIVIYSPFGWNQEIWKGKRQMTIQIQFDTFSSMLKQRRPSALL